MGTVEKGEFPFPPPKAVTWWDGENYMVRCPCGHTDEIDCFDVGGADDDCVFCNKCGQEISLV